MSDQDVSDSFNSPVYTDVLFDLSPNLVIYLGNDDTVCRMSRIARELFGFASEADVRGKNILDLIQNPVLLLLVRKWFEKLNRGMEVDETFPLDRLHNDRYEWYQVKAANVPFEGRLVGKVFFITEVTHLYSHKKILDALMVSTPGDIVVFDRKMQILLVSDSVARANGFHSWRDLEGRNLGELKLLDIALVERMRDQIILSDGPVHQVMKSVDERDGIHWNYVDLRKIDSTAGVFGYILTRIDITAEIKPKAILEAVMESSSDAIAIVNPDGIIEYASRALVGYLGIRDWHSVIGVPWATLFRNANPANRIFAELFSGDFSSAKDGTIAFDQGDGRCFFNYRVQPLNYQNENFGIITMATNTTELVGARDRAESAVRAKAAFLANMSHELRTPMNAVLGMNELLSRTPLAPIQKNYVTHIRSSATMLLSIINDILDFSRIEDQKLELSEAVYDVNSLLHDVINLIAVKAAEKDLSFTVDIDPSVPAKLVGDELHVKQILINLLNNAVKFTDSGGINLAVSAIPSGDGRSVWVSFGVRDTGIGIPADRQAEIFERFSRVENGQGRMVEGSGLGLAICKGLVSLMGGNLTLESDEGAGSVFTAGINQRIAAGSEPLAVFRFTSTVSLLVFNTDPSCLASIRQMAGYARVRADFCSDPADFARKLEGEPFAWTHVILEYRTGYEAALKAAPRLTGTRWLALLAMTDFISQGKDPAIDFIFQPLVIPAFARFIQGEHVDFTMSLPLVSSLGVSSLSFRTSGMSVLVVDDSAVNRKVAEGFLESLDIHADEADSGRTAIALAEQRRYDLVLLDHMMPGMDGPETALLLRAIPGYRDVPIVALTANAGASHAELYRQAGMNDCLLKPIEFNAFVACLKKWLPPSHVEGDWIPGLDRESGISFTGSLQNLEMILKVFSRSGPKMLEQLEEGRRSGSLAELRAAVHALISSGANIGGVTLSAKARELERAVLAGATAEIDELYPVVRDELEKIVAGVARHTEALVASGGKK